MKAIFSKPHLSKLFVLGCAAMALVAHPVSSGVNAASGLLSVTSAQAQEKLPLAAMKKKKKKKKKKGKKNKRKKIVNTLGVYSGTYSLSNIKEFNGANCTINPTFPAAFTVGGSAKRPSAAVIINGGNVQFSGKGNKSGATLKARTSASGNRDIRFNLMLRKSRKGSAKSTFTETIFVGPLKACVFRFNGQLAKQ